MITQLQARRVREALDRKEFLEALGKPAGPSHDVFLDDLLDRRPPEPKPSRTPGSRRYTVLEGESR